MISKESSYDLIDNVSMDDLSKGILDREYLHNEILVNITFKDKIKNISDSIFDSWIKFLSLYYLETLNPDTKLSGADIPAPAEIFTIPNLMRYKELKSKKSKSKLEKEEYETLHMQIKHLKSIFKNADNFLTSKLLKQEGKEPKFVAVTEDDEIIARTKIMAQFAELIHKTISLHYLCMHLLKSLVQLGEIYEKNPKHFVSVFSVLDLLCKDISNSIDNLRKTFDKILEANDDYKRSEAKERFPGIIRDQLDEMESTVRQLGDKVRNYRERVAKNLNINEPTIESVKHEMYELINILAQIYSYQPAHRPKHKTKIENPIPEPNTHPANTQDTGAIETPSVKTKEPALLTTSAKKPATITANNKPNFTHENTIDKKLLLIDQLIKQISLRIILIKNQERSEQTALHFASEIKAYNDMLDYLKLLQTKCIDMQNVDEKTTASANNSNDMLHFTLAVCVLINDYLNLNRIERIKKTPDFAQRINLGLENKDNKALLYQHTKETSKQLYDKTGLTLFQTDTRWNLNKLSEACADLTRIFSNGNVLQIQPA